MSRCRVKICGMTRLADVRAAVRAGADAVGFVFSDRSKRMLDPAEALPLCQAVPAFVTRVGLFLDHDAEYVSRVLAQLPLNLLQFHGREEAGFCRQFGLPYIKAVSMERADAVARAESRYEDAAGLLVDSHEPGGAGGTGRALDWNAIRPGAKPLILAGGLTPENVAEAVNLVRPWAVDVSSGVEDAPGKKNADAMVRFIREVKREY